MTPDMVSLRDYFAALLAQHAEQIKLAFSGHRDLHSTYDEGHAAKHLDLALEVERLRNRLDSLEQSRANLEGRITMIGIGLGVLVGAVVAIGARLAAP